MTIVTTDTINTGDVASLLTGPITVTAADTAHFVVSSSTYGTLTVTGSNLTYGDTLTNLLTGGTITGLTLVNGTGTMTWSGVSVSALTAYNYIKADNTADFNNLFFGGDDTFNVNSKGVGHLPTVTGLAGNDTFNFGGSTLSNVAFIDGGAGNNILNLTGAFNDSAVSGTWLKNVQTVHFAAGFNSAITLLDNGVVAAGATLTLDASSLGSGNTLTFNGQGETDGNLVILGGAGNDVLSGGSGTNVFNGGAGINTVDLRSNVYGGVTVNLALTGPQNIGAGHGTDTFISIENLIGTNSADVLTGDAGDNVITGGGGNDTIDGGGGNDTVVFSGPHTAYTVLRNGTGYTVTDNRPIAGSVTMTDGTDTITNVENFQFSDGTFAPGSFVYPPVITGGGGTVSYSELQAPIAVDLSALKISDLDSTTLTSATVAISSGFVAGDVLGFTNQNGIVAGYDANTHVMTLSGTASLADYQTALQSVTFYSGSQNPDNYGNDKSRTLSFAVNDGQSWSAAANIAVQVDAVDNPPVVHNDAFTVAENGILGAGLNLFADNGSGADSDVDGPALSISAVSGVAASVGSQITLGSGALLTVNADGTFSYNPNHAFDSLAAAGSGATDTSATDSFTAVVAGGGTKTVTLTIQGVDSNDTLDGTSGNEILLGGIGADVIYPVSGNDYIDGGSGFDTVVFSGNRASYTIQQNSDGSYRVTGPGVSTPVFRVEQLQFDDQTVAIGAAVSAPVRTDLNDDHNSDILWQADNGTPGVWFMDGTTVLANPGIGSNPGPSWHIVGSGDFDGDGHADVVWQNTDGTPGLWLMSGATVLANPEIGTDPGPSWHIVGVGDFNGDGKADLAWQNSNGQAGIWLMNGTTVLSNPSIGTNADPAWHIVATGDLNGDGKSDIVWQNDGGQIGVWFMDGATVLANPSIGNNNDPNWRVVGTGDFDGDGEDDLLLQNTANGQAAIWLMDGATIVSQTQLGVAPGQIKGTADLNGDGKADILWQSANGQAGAWLMSSTTILSSQTLGSNPGTSWHVVVSTGG